MLETTENKAKDSAVVCITQTEYHQQSEQGITKNLYKSCVVIGQMDNIQDHTYESANRIYSCYGLCPTIPTSCGGGHTPKVLVGGRTASKG